MTKADELTTAINQLILHRVVAYNNPSRDNHIRVTQAYSALENVLSKLFPETPEDKIDE